VIETEAFALYLRENVIATHFFQVGCVMEPTLDPRLADLLLMVAESPAKPRVELMLQTNGILLARHDAAKLRASGLTALSVSVDAAEPATQKLLRNGTSLDKVIRNVVAFRAACPEARIEFITTVTKANIDKIDALVSLGLDIGVEKFVLREVFYHRENDIVDHTRMPDLVLAPDEFDHMRDRLIDRFSQSVELTFADCAELRKRTRKMTADSLVR
jgi:MoaA/NifB/PqqE/SkfB family radical SAM enzyme